MKRAFIRLNEWITQSIADLTELFLPTGQGSDGEQFSAQTAMVEGRRPPQTPENWKR